MRLSIIFAWLLMPVAVVSRVVPITDCYGKADGTYADALSCSYFYQCLNEVAYHMPCGVGTAFNPESLICDFPANANCDATATTSRTTVAPSVTAAQSTTGNSNFLICYPPCINGECLGDDVCRCDPGYTGDRCGVEINECESVPCHNGGTCNEQFNGYTCSCSASFTGNHCQTRLIGCASSPCQNGATCTGVDEDYTCTCTGGFTGTFCETDFPPNIILVVVDDMGSGDLEWIDKDGTHMYGSPDCHTPRMSDIINAWGTYLGRYYTQCLCTPSRVQLNYGIHEMRDGLQHSVIHGAQRSAVNITFQSLAEMLKTFYGYRTHLCGKYHMGHYDPKYWPTNRGFDTFFGHLNGFNDHFRHTAAEEFQDAAGVTHNFAGHDFFHNMEVSHAADGVYSTDALTERAIELLDHHVKYHKDQPIFLEITYSAPHYPLQLPNATNPNDICEGETECARDYYVAMVENLDQAVGKVYDKLRSLPGVWENTILLFTSDNGGDNRYGGNNYPLRGRKFSNFEGGIRGAAWVASPFINEEVRGVESRAWLHISDFFPSIINLVAKKSDVSDPPLPSNLDGFDVWDLIRTGADESPRQELIHTVDELTEPYGIDHPDTAFDERITAALTAIMEDPLTGILNRFKIITGNPAGGQFWYNPAGNDTSTSPDAPPSKNVWLFNIDQDIEEKYDYSGDVLFNTIRFALLDRLQEIRYDLDRNRPCHFPANDLLANPTLWGGSFWPWVSNNLPVAQYKCMCGEP